MDRLTKIIFGFLILTVLAIVILNIFVERVPVRSYGVKQVVWGGGGIVKEDFETGFHLGITGIHKWHILDASTHFLDFTAAPERKGVKGPGGYVPSLFPKSGGPEDFTTPVHRRYPALEIRNRDGNIVSIDVTIPYHIIEGEAWKIVDEGLKAAYQDRVKAQVESKLREVLPELSNQGLQSTEQRLATAEKTLADLNKDLKKFHVAAETVLIRGFTFPPDYEEKLQQKQLFTQKARLDQADTLRFEEELKTGAIEKEIAAAEALSLAEWEKKMEVLRAEYLLKIAAVNAEAIQYSKKTIAEGEAEYVTRLAEGNLALDKAEALLVQLRSAALSSTGGKIYVAQQAAENLNLKRVTLNASDSRVPLILDLHSLADMLLGTPEGEEKPAEVKSQ